MSVNKAFVLMTCCPNQVKSCLYKLSQNISNLSSNRIFLCLAPHFGENLRIPYICPSYPHSDISKILHDVYQSIEHELREKKLYFLFRNLTADNQTPYNYENSNKENDFFDILSNSNLSTTIMTNYIKYHFQDVAQDTKCNYLTNMTNQYSIVAVGGTFDRFHNGHKLLLSESCILTKSKLIVGITSENMIMKKELSCLIESYETRSRSVIDFCNSVMPNLEVKVTQLNGRYGPEIMEGDVECLVVTDETLKFTDQLNSLRNQNGVGDVAIHTVNLIETIDGEKLSSSLIRHKMLGTLLKPFRNPVQGEFSENKAYFIGLVGCSCSGKSSIGREFNKLGAGYIDLDKIAHETYLPGTPVYSKIIETFGDQIISPDRTINRQKLGKIVFSDKEMLDKLNSIVRPPTRELSLKYANALVDQGYKIIIFDGAVLIESNFYLLVHEVWVAVLDRDLACQRLCDRNGLDFDEAKRRLRMQLSDQTFMEYANVVFCSKWDYSYTKQQIDKTWNRLRQQFS